MTRWQDDTMTLCRRRILSSLLLVILSLLVALNAWLTIRDYFGTWANEYIVRFQYHAPTREVAQWLNQHPEITDVAVGTNPYQLVLDPLALKLDLPRDIPTSWFDAETSLVKPHTGPAIFTALQPPGSEVRQILSDTAQLQASHSEFEVYSFQVSKPRIPPLGGDFDHGRLVLRGINSTPDHVKPGDVLTWRTYWLIDQSIAPVQLKMFLHVLNDNGEVMAGADREDLNFSTLSVGDAFWQVSQLTLPANLTPGSYPVEVGWYNPETGERLKRDDGSDRFLLTPLEVIAP